MYKLLANAKEGGGDISNTILYEFSYLILQTSRRAKGVSTFNCMLMSSCLNRFSRHLREFDSAFKLFFTNRSLIRRVCFGNLWPKYVSKIFLLTKNWRETFKVEIIRSETTIIWGKRWRIKVPSHKICRQCELQISILFARRLQQLGWETKEIVWTQSSEKRSAGEVTDQ